MELVVFLHGPVLLGELQNAADQVFSCFGDSLAGREANRALAQWRPDRNPPARAYLGALQLRDEVPSAGWSDTFRERQATQWI